MALAPSRKGDRPPEVVPGRSSAHPIAFAAAVIAAGIASWLPVLISVETRPLVAWPAAIIIGLIVERLTRAFPPTVLVAGLILASTLVASGLVTEETRYMPVLVASTAIALRCALDMWRQKRLYPAPPTPVAVAAGLYLVWAAFATVTSVDHHLSATYLPGMIAVLALAFWVIPALLRDRDDRKLLLAVIGGLGVAVALSVYGGSLVGPSAVFGRTVGDYLVGDLVVAGHATGLDFGRSAGVYLTPFEPGLMMAVGIISLLPLASFRQGRPRLLAALAVLFITPALSLALDRSAWLAAAFGAAAYAALLLRARLRARLSAVIALFFLLLVGAVTTNAIGVNTLREVCVVQLSPGETCPDWALRLEELSLRGGGGLSGRQFLWAASWDAIKTRPLLGYGPGTDVLAIEPHLSGAGLIYKGLTSHSTWFRTAVELGLPGLGLLVAIIAAAVWVYSRRLLQVVASSWDPVELVWPAWLAGLLLAMTFEGFLLGGVTLSSLYLAIALGLLAIPAASHQAAALRVVSAGLPAATGSQPHGSRTGAAPVDP